ncbi:MAG: rhodanese-like domain-containing protein [Actinomycetota bacterium]|nr:rhodanese-like domain-containing protein [Actinomycetota bacterium]
MSEATAETDEIAARLGDATLVLLDVRTSEEYDGVAGYACDPRQGHIPGARHVPVLELLALAPDDVRARIEVPPGGEVVAYCHSGGRSALAVSVLRSAGIRARNYEGSWHEWARREDLPVEPAS